MLLIITLVAGIALGITDALTRNPIAEQERIQAENARKSVLKDAVSFEQLSIVEDASVAWAYAGIGEDGQPIGYVAQKTIKGFGGDVDVIVGVNVQDPENLTLTGISVGGSKFKETAGLGARSKDKAFTDQFIGKTVPLKLIKNSADKADNTIDAITSATVTSNAVVNGVNDVVKFVKSDILGIAGIEMPERPADAQVFGASAKGKQGPVYVEAAFDADDAITYISVGNEEYKEDMDGGAREADFLIQFIGKKAPVDIADVDTITGSTVTSTAVVNALNQAYELSQGREIAVPETPVLPEKPADAQVFGASAQGKQGPVYVEAAFDADDAITYISVGNEEYKEDMDGGAREADFLIQFIGKKAPVDIADVDTITGSTVTSTAVVNALNQAYELSQGREIAVPETPVLPEKPADAQVFGASAQGKQGPVYVEAAFDADDAITYISVGNEEYKEDMDGGAREADFLIQFIGKKAPVDIADVDTITGSTVTSTAVVNALNQAYELSKGDENAVPETPVIPEDVPTDTKTEPTVPASTENAPVPGEKTSPYADGSDLTGESLVFFTAVKADVAFQDDRIISVDLSGAQPGGDYAPLDHADAFSTLLIGKTAPVNAADLRVSGVPDYIGIAVALAVNNAFDKTASVQEGVQADLTNEQPAGSGVDARSGYSLVFFSMVKADVSLQEGTIASVALFIAQPGSEYAPLDHADAFNALLIGKKPPVSANDLCVSGVPDYVSAAVALAVNDACGSAPAFVSSADPASFDQRQPDAGSNTSSGSSLLFMTSVRTEAAFDGNMLSDFTLECSTVGGSNWEPMDREQEYLEALVGKAMPLSPADVRVSGDALDSAVMIALNQAYENACGQDQDAAAVTDAPASAPEVYRGECVIFFERVIAQAAFEDGRAVSVSVLRSGISEDPSEGSWISWTALEGEPLPLDPSAYIFDGVEDYVGKAIVIAVNQAYEQSLAGQQ